MTGLIKKWGLKSRPPDEFTEHEMSSFYGDVSVNHVGNLYAQINEICEKHSVYIKKLFQRQVQWSNLGELVLVNYRME